MRVLANENIPGESIEALRAVGLDIAWIRTDAPGASDAEVLRRASQEGRILLTLDKDFGELAFRSGLPATSGIVLLRVHPPLPARVTDLALRVFDGGREFHGLLVVAEPGRLREQRLPGQGT